MKRLTIGAAAFALAGCLIGATGATAEPSPVIQRLTEMPMTMFTYGLTRLSDAMDTPDFLTKGYLALVKHDREGDRIVLSLDKFVTSQPSDADVRLVCQSGIGELRAWAGIEDGKAKYGSSKPSGYFSPVGYDDAVRQAIMAEIDKMIMLKVRLTNTVNVVASCSAPLLGTTFSVDAK